MLPEESRNQVESITMDLSDSMRAITSGAFPNAIVIRDCFHVIKRGGDACNEIRLRLKREAVKNQNKDKSELKKHLKHLALQRKAYVQRMKKNMERNGKRVIAGKSLYGQMLVSSLRDLKMERP